ncbi:MAG: hypothetical protein NT013_22915 [Planctomycetia bacterium]|nr:hypothetical protein [Planctomycetia bacterium]
MRNLNQLLAMILLACVGCGSSGSGQERYIPTQAVALATVETALKVWQRGEPGGEIKGTKPLIFVTDSHRRAGQRLESFEILGEVPGETPRCLLVKVKLANPDAEEKVRYAVIGIDPLWVYRHEDLEMILHWDHPMPGPKSAVGDTAETKSATSESTTRQP